MIEPTTTALLGRTDLALTRLGFGGAPLGSQFVRVSETEAMATLETAWAQGVRYYDTAPFYGLGLSERRIGTFLQDRPRAEFVLSTKVGRILTAPRDPHSRRASGWVGGLPFEIVFDYSYDGVMRSYEDSLQRLGLTRVDVLLIHDLDGHRAPDRAHAYWGQLITGGWRALRDLKDSGCIKAIGAGINFAGVMPRFLELFDIDLFLVAGPYTLLEQDVLRSELPLCAERGVGIVLGAVFASGILATGAVEGAKYRYGEPDQAVIEKVRGIQAVCEQHGVSMVAVALQFPLAHPLVASVIPGALSPEHVRQNVASFRQAIPTELWSDLKARGLLPPDAPVPATP